MSTLATVGLEGRKDIVEVRGRLFCLTADACDAAIAAAHASTHFVDHWLVDDLGELISESSDPSFWRDGGILDIVDCRGWGINYGNDLGNLLSNMVTGLGPRDWQETLDQINTFIKRLTVVVDREWQDFMRLANATRPQHRPELFRRFGKGEKEF